MSNILNYFWPILIIIYIISPLDAHPLFFDDLIAAAFLLYFLYRNKQQKKYYGQHHSHHQGSGDNQGSSSTGYAYRNNRLSLDEAYEMLGVRPDSTWEEIGKAYRNKMSKSHPDKVSHLSEELQEKAKELTLRLNEAFEMIKRHKGKK